MFPFWKCVLKPLIEAADARRLLEIGALRGETTQLLLDALGPDAQLHVIDPRPQFDPEDHGRRFGGRYVFHRDLSHRVLPDLEPMDVALIDGDHNWYTVHGELEMLRASARAQNEPLPLLILHDVGWPYGRRDLYYGPEGIPPEFRHPHAQRGMRPGHRELVPTGGVNPLLDNATVEGGPRNGVKTALEDFLAAHDRPTRRLILPVYFGLAIVADEDRLARSPKLSDALDRLESAETRMELLELAESLRLQSVVAEHTAVFGSKAQKARAAERYLDLLKGSLLNQHHIENEARIEYLAAMSRRGEEPDGTTLRDPGFHLRSTLGPLEASREAGSELRTAAGLSFFPYSRMGRRRMDHLERALREVISESVPGDLVECGVGRGGGGILMRGFLDAYEIGGRGVWLADAYRNPELGPRPDLTADVNMVREGFARFGLLDDRVKLLQGDPARTIAAQTMEVALLRVDAGLVPSVREVLSAAYEKLAVGGFVIVDGCDDARYSDAVEAFHRERDPAAVLTRVDEKAISWRKTSAPAIVRPGVVEPGGGEGIPLVQSSAERCDLSVLVVVHDMNREARRTLRSLSRSYQRGIDGLDYEVIVIDNGSAPSERLGRELVGSFGPEFRYLDLGAKSTPSPAQALNRGAAICGGDVIALMIDGAHMLTPGVLSRAMEGLKLHAPAMAVAQQFYLGPGQQIETITEGYDQAYEDRLLGLIDWPTDGYRLFEISHFIGTRDWFDGIWESNCMFVPREVAEQVGLMEEGFFMPGGGFANLDLYERIASTPGLSVVSLLGEGSFHQSHGGTTTNQPDREERTRLLAEYRDHYRRLRGRDFRVLTPFHYLGGMPDSARRTKARRMGASGFAKTARALAGDGLPEQPAPLPFELEEQFTEAYWRSFRWRQTPWFGHTVARSPVDMIAYQQMIATARPDSIVVIRAAHGGVPHFLSTICELAGRGRVITIGETEDEDAAGNKRITNLAGEPLDPSTVAQVHEELGEPANAMLILGLAAASDLVDTFEAYADLVPVGSFVVFEDTIMGGNPIWPGMGPGPVEAISRIIGLYPEFKQEPAFERLTMSFNRGGYLRRT